MSAPSVDPPLAEDLLILATHPVDGRLRKPGYFDHALAGATLADLALAGAVRTEPRRAWLLPAPVSFTHPALAAAAAKLPRGASLPGGSPLSGCLVRLRTKVTQPYLDTLVASGLFRPEPVRVLGLFPVTRYYLTDPSARLARVARIDATLASPAAALPRDLALTTLAATVSLTARLDPARPGRPDARLLATLTRADHIATAVAASIRAARNSS